MVTTEQAGVHEIHWDEDPESPSDGHGVQFRWSGDDSNLHCAAFLVGYRWLHQPGQAPVVVELVDHGKTRQPRLEGFADAWPQVRDEAKEAVRRFLAKPDPRATYGRITVLYNA